VEKHAGKMLIPLLLFSKKRTTVDSNENEGPESLRQRRMKGVAVCALMKTFNLWGD
jgi:hypothetical protein